jgi:tetratricopeptide (TPR) repeat protein
MLGMLESATKDSLTDERLRRVRALMGKDAAEAERLLLGVLAQDALPKDQEFEAHTHLGNILFATGRTDEAKASWGRAIGLGVANQTPAANLATTLLICERTSAAAREVVERGMNVDPRSAALMNVKGLLEWDDGNTKEALELFRKAYSIEDRPEFLMNEWNLLLEETGKNPSDDDVAKALERYPSHKELLLLFANRMLDRFQATHEGISLQKAGEALTKAFPVDLGRLERDWDRSVVSPLDWEWMACALNTMGAVVYWQGDLRRAESLSQLAIVFEDNPLFHFAAGQVQIAMGRIEQAITCFERAAALGFDKADLWCQLGNAHYVLFRRTAAKDHLNEAAAAYEKGAMKNPTIFVNLAQLCWDIGDRDKAKELVALALKENAKDPVAMCNSLLYASDGKPEKVLAGMSPIEAAYPTHPTVLTMIGESHYHLGNWEAGYAYFVRAIDAAGPNSFLLDQVYPLAARALKRSVGGEKGSLAAMEFLLRATERLPQSAGVQQTLHALAADLKLT